jgi:hypothetical protein
MTVTIVDSTMDGCKRRDDEIVTNTVERSTASWLANAVCNEATSKALFAWAVASGRPLSTTDIERPVVVGSQLDKVAVAEGVIGIINAVAVAVAEAVAEAVALAVLVDEVVVVAEVDVVAVADKTGTHDGVTPSLHVQLPSTALLVSVAALP